MSYKMPIQTIKRDGQLIGFRWGNEGKIYTTSEYGKKAFSLAMRQGRAISISKARASGHKIRLPKRRRDGVKQRYWVQRNYSSIPTTKSELGKTNRAKGLRFEFKILNKLKKQYPHTTFRSSGSHSLIDLLVREPDKYRIVVARSSGNLSPKEREQLGVFDKPYEQVEVWSRPSPKKIKKEFFKRGG